MKRLTRLSGRIALLWLMLPLLQSGSAAEVPRPIVDVRFDAPYRQIGYSHCDNWAPTWGADDALYTGCDDGTSFGGIARNPIAFGKLTGSDPYQLHGVTLNGMRDFREGRLFQFADGYTAGGATYRLAQCGATASSPAVCLTGPKGSQRLFSARKFPSPSFVTIDENAARLMFGPDAGQWVFAVAPAGPTGGEEQYFIGRVSKSKLSEGRAQDWSFWDKDFSWTRSPEDAAPAPNHRFVDANGSNWKMTNAYSVDGTLYVFITRIQAPQASKDPRGRNILRDASIIKSSDQGRSWMRPDAENRRRPLFPGQRFGAPYFVWYAKDGAARVDNADRYVYAMSNDGYWESGNDYVIGRVARGKLANLSAKDWSFYRAGDGMKDESWTTELARAKPVLSDPGQASMTGVTYIEGLGRYVMVSWHYPSHGLRDAIQNGDTHTVLEFFEAPHPWGPWSRFKTFNTGRMSWYTPIIWQRFQTRVDGSTVSAFISASSLQMQKGVGYGTENYKFNYMPIILSTHPLEHGDLGFAGGK